MGSVPRAPDVDRIFLSCFAWCWFLWFVLSLTFKNYLYIFVVVVVVVSIGVGASQLLCVFELAPTFISHPLLYALVVVCVFNKG